jgi:hypothetical protein
VKSKNAAVRVLAITTMMTLMCGTPRATEQDLWHAKFGRAAAMQSKPVAAQPPAVSSLDGVRLAALDTRSAAYFDSPVRTAPSAEVALDEDATPAFDSWALVAAGVGMVIFMTRRRLAG